MEPSVESREAKAQCALSCALPASKTIALGSYGTEKKTADTNSENQQDSKSSHSVLERSTATVNRRVIMSILAQRAKVFTFKRL